ncbi:TetR/AcrR family transcriptional regulator [Emcibacter sp.]|uniref:TetR/AcrR family transcriptional regulator n=1 Tax=Emcibacter sp. TaxID=1979954 RepID=UPI002AA7ED9D|nr:TetR/AcrR family transcriptional regulator [Emcibacter sp.]
MRKLTLTHPDFQDLTDQKAAKVLEILEATQFLLIEEGYAGLSMRKVAARCNMTVGNLTYYFSTKQDLVHVLLDVALEGYNDHIREIMSDSSLSGEEQLARAFEYLMQDLMTRETTRFFPELWAMSNHDPVVNREVQDLYIREQEIIEGLVKKVRPDLATEDLKKLSLYISAAIEGHTIFIGHDKSWNDKSREIIDLAVNNFLDMVRNYGRDRA